MSILTVLSDLFFTDIITTIITLTIGFAVFKISRFYYKVLSLPPGPFPLPLLGNILSFRTKDHWDSVLRQFNKKYGPVFTVWFGNNPNVIITDIDIGRDAFRKSEFSGRIQSYFGTVLSNEQRKDVIMTDYGHNWEALRRVAHSAAQKYSTNEKLENVVSDTMDYVIKVIIDKEGIDKQFSPRTYIYLIFLNILATSAFGKRFDIEEEDFKKLKYALADFLREIGSRFFLWEFSSFIRFLDRKMVKKHQRIVQDMIDMIDDSYKSHLKDYDQNIERDFCDALITAKNEAIKAGKETVPYLTDVNLVMVIFDLFLAGTDTSQNTFQWLILLLTYYPDVQKKLRQEIDNEIGDRIPTHEDKGRCHYVMAFITETMRLRNVVPFGVPHKAVVTTKINDNTIPEGNGVFVYQAMILTDEKYWPNPQEFRPERFLENGKFITTRSKAYIPFGVGRRVCLGEKLAIADLFLVLVRFLQSTSDYDLELAENGGIGIDPNVTESITPKQYKIIFKSKK